TFEEYLSGRDLAGLLAHETGGAWLGPGQHGGSDLTEWGVDPQFVVDARAGCGGTFASVSYTDPPAFSAAVADPYRGWLCGAGRSTEHALVTSGRLVDPGSAIARSLVPYWCPNATAAAVAGAELWLAGAAGFATIRVLPEPPGAAWSRMAT